MGYYIRDRHIGFTNGASYFKGVDNYIIIDVYSTSKNRISYTSGVVEGALSRHLKTGHLDDGEPIVKPTSKGRFYVFLNFLWRVNNGVN
jgi:hypothetical protein